MNSSISITSISGAKQVTKLATIAILDITYFIVAVVALHFLRPDLDPVKQHMSAYAVGPYGFLMTSAFFALAFGSLVLAIALWQGISPVNRSRVGLILLAVFGIGVTVAGIFPTDLEGAPPTVSGSIHELAFLVSCLSLIVAMIMLSRNFQREEKLRSFGAPALTLALLALVALLGFFATAETEFLGLGQRIFVAIFLIWLLLTSIRLRSVDTAYAAISRN